MNTRPHRAMIKFVGSSRTMMLESRSRRGEQKINRTGPMRWNFFFLVQRDIFSGSRASEEWAACFSPFKFCWCLFDLWWLINELIQVVERAHRQKGKNVKECCDASLKRFMIDLQWIPSQYLIDLMSFFKSFSYQFLIALPRVCTV